MQSIIISSLKLAINKLQLLYFLNKLLFFLFTNFKTNLLAFYVDILASVHNFKINSKLNF